ncbi:hypothetical protein GGR51DRAFT_564522 [Nemania sp. FL0031]|nr:hypothetical protein GGR51DRAFT_564522 [Nemania sp. FL0031]
MQSVRKRLFVFCDGTWQDSVNKTGYNTNVTTLSRCLEGVADDGYLQISYYDSGIGNTTSLQAHLVDGATGRGMSSKIRNAYNFLASNYSFQHSSDEIFLVGFSRGAFAVQCLASFISQTGLLHKPNLYFLDGLFTLWANQQPLPSHKRSAKNILADRTLELEGLGALSKVKIKACVVWDTVSNLVTLTPWMRPFSFVGSRIPSAVQHAFQVLALDEARSQFKPSIWTSKDSQETKAKQCWFLGSHADVGGNGNAALGAITLIWIIAQLRAVSNAKFNETEIQKHLKLRFFEWKLAGNWFSRRLKQSLTLSHRSSSGHATDSSLLWFLLGRRPRKLSAGVHHHNTDIKVSVHFTVRLAMIKDPTMRRLLRNWQTILQNGSVYWCQKINLQIEDMIEEDEIGPYEFETLQAWSKEQFEQLSTERTAFFEMNMKVPKSYREEARGAVEFAAFLLNGVECAKTCLHSDYMYNVQTRTGNVLLSKGCIWVWGDIGRLNYC